MVIKIFIADDHKLVRDGLRALFESQKDIYVVGDAGDGEQTLRGIKKYKPDIVLLDIAMPKMNGLEICNVIHDNFPEMKILIITMFNDEDTIFKAIDIGVDGFIPKHSAAAEVIKAIQTIAQGKHYISKSIPKSVINKLKDPNNCIDQISDREIEIIKYLAQGMTTNEIADKIYRSWRTVETHRKNIMKKLGVKNTPSLVKRAIECNLVPFMDYEIK